jgi:hypothetical protein
MEFQLQLALALGIMSPLSIRTYGMLMQTSKSINKAASEWETALFEKHRVVQLLGMARTTKKRDKSYYVCNSTWQEWPLMLCCKFYIPIRSKKRRAKDILWDYVTCMQQNAVHGIIRVEFKRSVKTCALGDSLNV